jgi:hypothetical protein
MSQYRTAMRARIPLRMDGLTPQYHAEKAAAGKSVMYGT